MSYSLELINASDIRVNGGINLSTAITVQTVAKDLNQFKWSRFYSMNGQAKYNSTKFIKGFVKLKAFLGRPLDYALDSSFTNASPTQLAVFNIYQWDPSGTTQTSMFFRLKLKYYVKFFDPINLTAS